MAAVRDRGRAPERVETRRCRRRRARVRLARAAIAGEAVSVNGMTATPDGARVEEMTLDGTTADAAEIGREVGRRLKERGGPDFFVDWV